MTQITYKDRPGYIELDGLKEFIAEQLERTSYYAGQIESSEERINNLINFVSKCFITLVQNKTIPIQLLPEMFDYIISVEEIKDDETS